MQCVVQEAGIGELISKEGGVGELPPKEAGVGDYSKGSWNWGTTLRAVS